MRRPIALLLFISLAFALGFTACSLSLAQDVTPPPGYQPPTYQEPEVLTGVFPEPAPDPANGEAIYQEKCLPCHGDTGMGNGPDSTALPVEVAQIGAPQIINAASPLAWYSIISQGNIDNFMPPFSGSLSEQDIWDVLSYVYTFGRSAEKAALGEEVYAETCAACHGVDGSGAVPGAADLTDAERMVMLSIEDIVLQVSTGNGNQDHVFSTVLDAEQQENVAYYLRTFVFPLEGDAAVAEQPADEEPTEEEQPADAEPTEADTEEPAEGDDTTVEATPEAGEEAGETAEEMVTFGKVTGQVIQGSGEELPEGLEVTLESYEHFEPVFSLTREVAEDGSFEFDAIPIVPDQIYIAVVELDGVFYPSEFYVATPDDEEIDLPVTIYSPTTSTEDLAISRMHVFFQFTGQGTVQVIHQVTISNRGSQMVAPERDSEPILNFSLPEDADNLIFEQGALGSPYIKTANGFADPTAVLPGEGTYEVLFAYELPYDRSLDWQLPVGLPAEVAVVFVQGGDVKVSSETLAPSGTEQLDTEVFQVFVANGLTEGETIDLDISGRAGGGTAAAAGDTNWLLIGAGVVGVVLAAFGAWQFFRPQDDDYYEFDDEELEFEASEAGEMAEATANTSGEIMDQIIALDRAYESGDVSVDDYHAKRAALKAALEQALEEEEGA